MSEVNFLLYFYQEKPHPDVQVLVECHSVKYMHNVSDTISQDGNSELYAWDMACGAFLWLVSTVLARSAQISGEDCAWTSHRMYV